ncbi:MAG: Rieske (2Fe-2S) domain protein [Chloroflexi bacterium]|nr:Rieske (2Fe-2S) domain protein [Chloroflexota bacterium]
MAQQPTRDVTRPSGRVGPPWLDRFGGIYAALIPLRAFLGFTFLYAGLDKFATKGFLAAMGPGSIGEQLEAFTRSSPLTPLIEAFALPYPVAMGTFIALAEIAVGLGVLTGLLYRAAAAGGAFTALIFWLTASWTTTPFYFGPDLPVMFGFITLALAGNGGLLVAGNLVPDRRGRGTGAPARIVPVAGAVGRRELLQAALLGVAAIAAGVGARLLLGGDLPGTTAGAGSGTPSPSPAGTTPAPSSPGPGGTAGATPGGPVIGNVNQLAAGEAVAFTIPSSGDPGAAIRLADGRVVAYDLICTHEGCTVRYDAGSGILRCPCHGATFDPAQEGLVLGGPARRPLPSVPLVIDPASGSITLAS